MLLQQNIFKSEIETNNAAVQRFLNSQDNDLPKELQKFFTNWEFSHFVADNHAD